MRFARLGVSTLRPARLTDRDCRPRLPTASDRRLRLTTVHPTPTNPNRCSQLDRTSAVSVSDSSHVVERGDRLAPRLLHQLMIAQEVADAERRHAGLARAEEIARAALLEIALGDHEPVGGVGQRLEPIASLIA